MGGMLRRAAQAYLEMGGWDRKRKCINQCHVVESVKTQYRGCFRQIPYLKTRANMAHRLTLSDTLAKLVASAGKNLTWKS